MASRCPWSGWPGLLGTLVVAGCSTVATAQQQQFMRASRAMASSPIVPRGVEASVNITRLLSPTYVCQNSTGSSITGWMAATTNVCYPSLGQFIASPIGTKSFYVQCAGLGPAYSPVHYECTSSDCSGACEPSPFTCGAVQEQGATVPQGFGAYLNFSECRPPAGQSLTLPYTKSPWSSGPVPGFSEGVPASLVESYHAPMYTPVPHVYGGGSYQPTGFVGCSDAPAAISNVSTGVCYSVDLQKSNYFGCFSTGPDVMPTRYDCDSPSCTASTCKPYVAWRYNLYPYDNSPHGLYRPGQCWDPRDNPGDFSARYSACMAPQTAPTQPPANGTGTSTTTAAVPCNTTTANQAAATLSSTSDTGVSGLHVAYTQYDRGTDCNQTGGGPGGDRPRPWDLETNVCYTQWPAGFADTPGASSFAYRCPAIGAAPVKVLCTGSTNCTGGFCQVFPTAPGQCRYPLDDRGQSMPGPRFEEVSLCTANASAGTIPTPGPNGTTIIELGPQPPPVNLVRLPDDTGVQARITVRYYSSSSCTGTPVRTEDIATNDCSTIITPSGRVLTFVFRCAGIGPAYTPVQYSCGPGGANCTYNTYDGPWSPYIVPQCRRINRQPGMCIVDGDRPYPLPSNQTSAASTNTTNPAAGSPEDWYPVISECLLPPPSPDGSAAEAGAANDAQGTGSVAATGPGHTTEGAPAPVLEGPAVVAAALP